MADFLSTRPTLSAITKIIDEAVDRLVILCPYNTIAPDIRDRLTVAARKGVLITLVFGKRRMDPDQQHMLLALPGLRLLFSDRLHAKCYFNHREMVIASLNLLVSSETNWEMGVRLCAAEAAYAEAAAEADRIIGLATPVSSDVAVPHPTRRVDEPSGGHCIRCAGGIPKNASRPFCGDCFDSWAEWENWEYSESVCHNCGSESRTSRRQPLCAPCRPSRSSFFARRI